MHDRPCVCIFGPLRGARVHELAAAAGTPCPFDRGGDCPLTDDLGTSPLLDPNHRETHAEHAVHAVDGALGLVADL